MITKSNYLIEALKSDMLYNIEWYYSFLTILDLEDKYEEKFLRVVYAEPMSYLEVMINGRWEILVEDDGENYVTTTPVFELNRKLTLPAKCLPNLDSSIETTLGRAIVNKTVVSYAFGNKIPYVNERIDVKYLEKIVSRKLHDETIKVSEYIKFCDSLSFIRGLTRITNVSATYKNVLPPPDLDKHKKRITEEFNNKYGPNWVKERIRVVEFQEELKKVDAEWLKGDPSVGRLINNKIKNNARVKMYLTFGPEVGFDKSGEKMTFIQNSLTDGYTTKPEEVAAMCNAARSGSYDRGKETQKGGAAAKDVLRATGNFVIKGKDCGSNLGKKILVTEDNYSNLSGRYLVSGQLIQDAKSYLGKVIEIRSPMYCKNKDSSFCETCAGDNMSDFKNGISLKCISISATLMTISLKGMHDTQVKLTDFNLYDAIK